MDEQGAMFSIRAFSDFTGLNESTLRYYDKIGLLSPVMRGGNNYRYYAPHQIILADFIKVLSMLGVPLTTIKGLSKNRTPQSVLALLGQQQGLLNMRMHELRLAYSIIHAYRSNIQAGMFACEQEMQVRELDELRLVFGPVNDFSKSNGTFYQAFINFCNQAHDYKINLHYPIGGYHESFEAFLRAPHQPTRFFAMDPCGDDTRAAGKHLVAYKEGYYGQFGDLAQRMDAHARDHGLTLHGPVHVIYLLDEISVADPDKYLVEATVCATERKS